MFVEFEELRFMRDVFEVIAEGVEKVGLLHGVSADGGVCRTGEGILDTTYLGEVGRVRELYTRHCYCW